MSWQQKSQLKLLRAALGPSRLRSITEALAGDGPGSVGPADLLLRVAAALANEDIGHVGLADLGAGEVYPSRALVAFDHGSASKRL